MSISTETSSIGSSAAVAKRPRQRTFSPISLLIIAILSALLLWYAGVFRGDPQVAIVTSGDGPYWDPVVAGAQDAARAYDVKLNVIRPKSDKQIQSQKIQEVLRGQPAGIAVSPLDPAFQSTVLADVAANTILVTFDSDSPVSRRLCFVGTDNYSAGRLLGDAVRKEVPDGGQVIICLGVPNKDNTQRRRQGVIDELLERPEDPNHAPDAMDSIIKGERYTVAATLSDEGDRAKAVELAAKALRDHPDVKCFVGLTGYAAWCVTDALKKAGRLGQVKVIGFDVDERTLAGIEAGDIAATVMQDQYGLGYHAVRILAAEAHGNRGELPAYQTHVLPCKLVRKDNVEQTRRELANPKAGAAVGPAPSQSTPPNQNAPTQTQAAPVAAAAVGRS
jgi:ribose transport system substrate-binding protein